MGQNVLFEKILGEFYDTLLSQAQAGTPQRVSINDWGLGTPVSIID